MNEIKTHDEAGVRRIVIARPEKRNALTRPMMQALADAVAAAEADDQVRAVLLTSEGGLFCAGADLDGLASGPLDEVDPGHAFLLNLAAARKPLAVAVQGAAVGIGATMLLHFDLVFAAPAASLRMPFIDLGVTPEAGSTFILPAMMGRAQASKLLLLGEALSAADALACGLVTEIVAPERLAERAVEAARKLAAKPPQAMAITKDLMRAPKLLALMDAEQAVFRERLKSDEFRAAVDAMRQRIKS